MAAAAASPLAEARGAARAACRAAAAVAAALLDRAERGGSAARNWRAVLESLESLGARARQAPSLLATWGPGVFLVYYFSKAAEALAESSWLRSVVVDAARGGCPSPSDTGEGFDSTGAGYLYYAAALLYLHRDQLACDPVQSMDAVVSLYLSPGTGFSRLLYQVENLSRMITLYLEPTIAEAKSKIPLRTERRAEDEDFIEAMRVVAQRCSMNC